ncbi:MAG: ABC transporter substrate-binding protein [Clostridia bacterium]
MYPARIVCLGAELPDIFHRLGALDRVVGISAYTDWPPEALTIPKVSGFRHGSARRILQTHPDLVILTSGVQKPLAEELAGHGVPLLHLYPHRLEDMFSTVRLLASLVGEAARAEVMVEAWRAVVVSYEERSRMRDRRPRVYFEEWMDPLIAGIGWVSDLIELAGGEDIFRTRALEGRSAAGRTLTPDAVVAACPDVILASWCGKPLNRAELVGRPGFSEIPAVARDAVVEIPPSILQCGPRLMDLLPDLADTIATHA